MLNYTRLYGCKITGKELHKLVELFRNTKCFKSIEYVLPILIFGGQNLHKCPPFII